MIPDSEKYDAGKSQVFIWGKATNRNGEIKFEVYEIEEGYSLTAKGAAEITIKVLNNEIKPGTHTPSQVFGSDFMKKYVVERII